jgi:predicted NodU family carbamoyl transferase|tara:strand:+ start:1511 stop:1624 length:114 start_codon:yes stop_codon:yes gene_type:complete
MKRQIILSISPIGHDTAAALMIDGEIVAACAQEKEEW